MVVTLGHRGGPTASRRFGVACGPPRCGRGPIGLGRWNGRAVGRRAGAVGQAGRWVGWGAKARPQG